MSILVHRATDEIDRLKCSHSRKAKKGKAFS
jgi:hypothetical protein